MTSWLAVASAEHVRIGQGLGFMQVCHGKGAPLRRVQPGDRVVYYAPAETMGGRDGLKSFVAIGVVRSGEPYQGDMGNGFMPFRRDVDWWPSREVPIHTLDGRLELTAERGWGYKLRFGLIRIAEADMDVIAASMRVGEVAPEPPA